MERIISVNEIRHGKEINKVLIPISYSITKVFDYENRGYTIEKVYSNCVILWKEV